MENHIICEFGNIFYSMDQAPAILVIDNCNVHSFKLKNKKIVNYGNCDLN